MRRYEPGCILTAMSPYALVVEQATHLPLDERKKLIRRLQATLPKAGASSASPDRRKVTSKGKVKAKSRPKAKKLTAKEREERRRKGMEMFLALAGKFSSGHTDVSSNKYKHLAEVYADKHDQ